MKRLFVWLASVSICAAQAVSIGPFATEDWVDERLQVLTNDFATIPYVDAAVEEVEDKIPDVSIYATKSYVNAVSNAIPDVSGFATVEYVDAVSNAIPDTSGFATKAYVDAVSNAIPDTSMFSTIEYVNTTSNNLALLMDDLVSEDELGGSVSNIVPAWALVPIPPVTAEVDPVFTNWLATTNVVIDDNVETFVSNVVPSWALVPIPPVTVEVDPVFTAWEGSNLYVRTTHSGPVVLQNTLVVGTASVDQNVTTAVAEGTSKAYANNSHAEGRETRTASNAAFSHVEGQGSKTGGQYSHAAGYRALTAEGGGSGGAVVVNPHDYAWAWNGDYTIGDQAWYASHGPGTFNVNPKGGISNFWIGETNLATYLQNAGGGGTVPLHASTHFVGGSDEITPNDIGALSTQNGRSSIGWDDSSNLTLNNGYFQIDDTAYCNSDVWYNGNQYQWPDHSGVIALTNDIPSTNGFIKAEADPVFTNWLATTNAVERLFKNTSRGSESLILEDSTEAWLVSTNITTEIQVSVAAGMSGSGTSYTWSSGSSNSLFKFYGPIESSVHAGMQFYVRNELVGVKDFDPSSTHSSELFVYTGGNIPNPELWFHSNGPHIVFDNEFTTVLGGDSSWNQDPALHMGVSASEIVTETRVRLASTNDIPAAVDRSIAVMTDIPMFWDHDSITNRNTGNTFDLSKFAEDSIQIPPDHTAFTLRYVPNGPRTFYYDGTNSSVGLFMVDNKGDPYISACNGQYASLIDPVFFDNKREAFEDIYGNNVRVDTTAFSPTCFMDNSNSNRCLWLTTNGVLKAGTVATVEDLAVVIENSDIVINNITNTEFTIEYTNPTEFFTYSNAVGHTDILLGTIEHAFDNGSLDVYPGGVGASVDGDVEITKYNIYLPESVLTFDSIAPMFSTNNVYTNGDFVIRNRHLYECTNATSGAWAPANWKQTSVTEILGNLRKILDEINGEAL